MLQLQVMKDLLEYKFQEREKKCPETHLKSDMAIFIWKMER